MVFSREVAFGWLFCVDVSMDFNAGGGNVNIDSISEGCETLSEASRSVDPVGVGGGFGRGIVEAQGRDLGRAKP